MKRCCSKCRTPFQICASKACRCHLTFSESSVNNTEPTVSSEPAPANVTPLFQEPTA